MRMSQLARHYKVHELLSEPAPQEGGSPQEGDAGDAAPQGGAQAQAQAQAPVPSGAAGSQLAADAALLRVTLEAAQPLSSAGTPMGTPRLRALSPAGSATGTRAARA